MSMLLRRRYAETDTDTQNQGAAQAAPKKSEDIAKSSAVTADDIKSMNGTKLRKLARENGIENPEELTVGELKAILVEMLS